MCGSLQLKLSLPVSSISHACLFSGTGAEAAAACSVSLPTTPTGSGDCVVFHGVTYLGCASVNAPRSEVEIYRNMAVLNEQTQGSIPIILSVPATADGTVRYYMYSSQSSVKKF